MKRNLRIKVMRFPDIADALCANRAHCVLANAVRRTLGQDKNIYLQVDGNGCAFSLDQTRYVYRMPKTAVAYLREFDELGRVYGQGYARVEMAERAFTFKLIETHAVAPPATSKRKDQINKARLKRNAKRKANGEPPKSYARYAGV